MLKDKSIQLLLLALQYSKLMLNSLTKERRKLRASFLLSWKKRKIIWENKELLLNISIPLRAAQVLNLKRVQTISAMPISK